MDNNNLNVDPKDIELASKAAPKDLKEAIRNRTK